MGEKVVGMTIAEHTLERPKGLIECQSVLDIGAGIRPMQWYKPNHHMCIEPYTPYAKVLERSGYHVINATAKDALTQLIADGQHFEAVYLLDVIEHMDRAEGFTVLELANQVATRQIVVFTPDGFEPQTKDVWGYGGHYWQTHKSGWSAEDFLMFDVSKVDNALFAVLTK